LGDFKTTSIDNHRNVFNIEINNKISCIEKCISLEFSFAAIKNETRCFCDDNLKVFGNYLNENDYCKEKKTDHNIHCIGDNIFNVYKLKSNKFIKKNEKRRHILKIA
jgi:hypothetical protein